MGFLMYFLVAMYIATILNLAEFVFLGWTGFWIGFVNGIVGGMIAISLGFRSTLGGDKRDEGTYGHNR